VRHAAVVSRKAFDRGQRQQRVSRSFNEAATVMPRKAMRGHVHSELGDHMLQ